MMEGMTMERILMASDDVCLVEYQGAFFVIENGVANIFGDDFAAALDHYEERTADELVSDHDTQFQTITREMLADMLKPKSAAALQA